MKKSVCDNVDLEARFSDAGMANTQMDFLRGGDGDGGQGADGPWDPPG